MSDDDAEVLVEVPTSRVLGLGVGIFVIVFFTICFIVIFLISAPCSVRPKLFWRCFASVSLALIVLLLIYAPRESAYVSTDDEIKVLLCVVMGTYPLSYFHQAIIVLCSCRCMTNLSFRG